MTGNPSEGLFPLPLVTFEHYMIADDRPGQPMGSVRQLLLSGRLQEKAFGEAIALASERHPLLSALVEDPHGRAARWVAAGDIAPRIDWGEIGDPLQARADEFIDLTVEVGLRVWIRQGSRGAIVTVQFHHACVDGTGTTQFIADLLSIYATLTGGRDGRTSDLQDLRYDLLSRRGEISSKSGKGKSQLSFKEKVRKTFRFLTRKPSALNAPASAPDSSAYFPGLASHVFSAQDTQHLRRVARQQGASLNDLLVRDLFLALDAWNEENQTADCGRWMRICMPVNMRTGEHVGLPAANAVSYGFLTRGHPECEDPAELLDGICRDTAEIKTRASPAMFLRAVERIRKLTGGLRRASDPKKCYSTVVLSNVGDVTDLLAANLPACDDGLRAGDVVLRAVRGCPPLKPKTRVVFHVMTYRDEMTIAVRAWPELFDLGHTKDLLRRFVSQLHNSIAADGGEAGREYAEQSSWEDRAAGSPPH